MPVTKGSKGGEAKKTDQIQDDRNLTVAQSPDEKIPEKEDVSEAKERLPREDTNFPNEQICNSPLTQREIEGDYTDTVEKSEVTDSSTTKAEICISAADSPSELQQFEGTFETENLSPPGDGNNSPDITTSSLSICTQSEQDTELDTQSSKGTSLHCRNCKNTYTSSEDNSVSRSDLCPACRMTTNSPLRPLTPQPLGNPVKNQNISLDIISQSEGKTPEPVVVGGDEEPEIPPNKSSSPSTGSQSSTCTQSSTGNQSPESNQLQSNSTQSSQTTRSDSNDSDTKSCYYIVFGAILLVLTLLVGLGMVLRYFLPASGSPSTPDSSPSQNSSETSTNEALN